MQQEGGVRGRATGGTNYSGAGNSTQVNHRLTARHERGKMQLSSVWVCSEHPNKHWDPERNQEVPSPEGFTLLALAVNKHNSGPLCLPAGSPNSRRYGEFVLSEPVKTEPSARHLGTEIPSVTMATSSSESPLQPPLTFCQFLDESRLEYVQIAPEPSALAEVAWKRKIFPAGVQEFHRAHPLERSGVDRCTKLVRNHCEIPEKKCPTQADHPQLCGALTSPQ